MDENARSITFTHAQGGELAVTSHTTASTFAVGCNGGFRSASAATDTSGSSDAVIQARETNTAEMLKVMEWPKE